MSFALTLKFSHICLACCVSLKGLLFLTSHFPQLLVETLPKTFSVFIASTLIMIQVQAISLLSKKSPSSSGAHSPCCVPPGRTEAQVSVCITGLAWGIGSTSECCSSHLTLVSWLPSSTQPAKHPLRAYLHQQYQQVLVLPAPLLLPRSTPLKNLCCPPDVCFPIECHFAVPLLYFVRASCEIVSCQLNLR